MTDIVNDEENATETTVTVIHSSSMPDSPVILAEGGTPLLAAAAPNLTAEMKMSTKAESTAVPAPNNNNSNTPVASRPVSSSPDEPAVDEEEKTNTNSADDEEEDETMSEIDSNSTAENDTKVKLRGNIGGEGGEGRNPTKEKAKLDNATRMNINAAIVDSTTASTSVSGSAIGTGGGGGGIHMKLNVQKTSLTKKRKRNKAINSPFGDDNEDDDEEDKKRRLPALDLGGLTGENENDNSVLDGGKNKKVVVSSSSATENSKASTSTEDLAGVDEKKLLPGSSISSAAENSISIGGVNVEPSTAKVIHSQSTSTTASSSALANNNTNEGVVSLQISSLPQGSPQPSLQPSNAMHSHALPPERVMSPMPQREEAGSPLCPSPNMLEVGTTIAGTGGTGTALQQQQGQTMGLTLAGQSTMQGQQQQPQRQMVVHHNIHSQYTTPQQQQQQQQQQPLAQTKHQHVIQANQQLAQVQLHNRFVSQSNNNGAGLGLSPSEHSAGGGNGAGNGNHPPLIQQQQGANAPNNQQQTIQSNKAATTAVADGQSTTLTTPTSSSATLASSNQQIQQSQQSIQQSQSQQPPGWRVKLYRLNMDGTWDDCGTGRIQFYHARPAPTPTATAAQPQPQVTSQEQQQFQLEGGQSSSSSQQQQQQNPSSQQQTTTPTPTPTPTPTTPTSVFRELGEPMLCMRAEIPQPQKQIGSSDNNNDSNNDNNNNNKVLLRTRVLLTDNSYQCQGGNIITWCEPFNQPQQQQQQQSAQQQGNQEGGNDTDSQSANQSSSNKPLQQQTEAAVGNDNSKDSKPSETIAATATASSTMSPVASLAPTTTTAANTNAANTTATTAAAAGVDLALSFQDNGGCKDIWSRITNVQLRARDVLFANGGNNNQHHEQQQPLHHRAPSPGGNQLQQQHAAASGGGGGGLSIKSPGSTNNDDALMHHHPQPPHHPHQQHHTAHHRPLSPHHGQLSPKSQQHSPVMSHASPPQQQHHPQHLHYPHLHGSPDSPDHDAMEDQQLSCLVNAQNGIGGVGGMAHQQQLGIPPRPPLLSTAPPTKDGTHVPCGAAGGMTGIASGGGGAGAGNHPMASSGGQQPSIGLHVHNHAQNDDEHQFHHTGGASTSAADHNDTMGDNMTAVSMAAMAAASFGSGNQQGGGNNAIMSSSSIGENNDSSFSGNNMSGDGSTPLPMLPNNNSNNDMSDTQQQHQQQQQQQQQHGFGSLPLNFAQNSNNNNPNNINTLSSLIATQLPQTPTWDTLPQISDFITNCFGGGGFQQAQLLQNQQSAFSNLSQREELLIYLAKEDCEYLRKILDVYYSELPEGVITGIVNTNDEGEDGTNKDGPSPSPQKLAFEDSPPPPNMSAALNNITIQELYAELAHIIKCVLLLNDPEIIEYVTSSPTTFEQICQVLEYDSELKEKANHVDFLSEHAKFRTVIRMEDEELVNNIHRLFRVNYLRDVILRPTMDEGSLSTLVSLGQFTMSDVIKGVVMAPPSSVAQQNDGMQQQGQGQGQGQGQVDIQPGAKDKTNNETADDQGNENYLIQIIRMLGLEILAIRKRQWREYQVAGSSESALDQVDETMPQRALPLPPSCPPSSPLPKQHQEDEEVVPSSQSPRPYRPPSPEVGPPTPTSSPSPIQPQIKWAQHLAPQDSSLPSRIQRRSGCLSFLNELFNMARLSLQQHEKDDFVETSVTMRVPCELKDPGSEEKQTVNVNLLSLLSAVLSDPTTSAKERGCALEIMGVIAMHDPGLIRKYCLDYAAASSANAGANSSSNAGTLVGSAGAAAFNAINNANAAMRPDPNELREVLFTSPPDDVLLSLLYVMNTETDAGLLLSTSEIIRIILDTEMMGEGGQQGQQDNGLGLLAGDTSDNGGFLEDENDFNAANTLNGDENNPNAINTGENNENGSLNGLGPAGAGINLLETEQNTFLSLFYDRYIQWLVVPFQYKIVVPQLALPKDAIGSIRREFKQRTAASPLAIFSQVNPCPVRSSFTLEIVSFCVRAHVHRMKFFLLRSRLLGTILKILGRKQPAVGAGQPSNGLRCLKLASLKLLRSVLSVKDEFYHRHIVQYNLFASIFDLFRQTMSVGNNLLSSAILEMCDFICLENIKSLIDHIVIKHMSKPTTSANTIAVNCDKSNTSLEEIANPHVDTFKQLRKAYQDNNAKSEQQVGGMASGGLFMVPGGGGDVTMNGNHEGGLMMNGRGRSMLNKKGLEDQRKFREADEEESYFNDDDDDTMDVIANTAAGTQGEKMPATEEEAVASLMEDVKSLDD